MKTLKIIIFGMLMFFISGSAKAQVSVQINIGTPPQWGPSGYSDVNYYYLPDVEAYYEVNSSMFIFYQRDSWIRRTSLPTRYRNYDLFSGYKVVLSDYHGNTPYTYFHDHKGKYAKGYHGKPQPTNGHRPEHKSAQGHNYPKGQFSQKHNTDNNPGSYQAKSNMLGNGEAHGKGNGKKK